MQHCINIFIIPYLYEAQHVTGITPPISRNLKLQRKPLVFHTWEVVGPVDGGRCQAVACEFYYDARIHEHQVHKFLLLLPVWAHVSLWGVSLFPCGFRCADTKCCQLPSLLETLCKDFAAFSSNDVIVVFVISVRCWSQRPFRTFF
jgi:hypothetical protein